MCSTSQLLANDRKTIESSRLGSTGQERRTTAGWRLGTSTHDAEANRTLTRVR
jgi:hypothetical protein